MYEETWLEWVTLAADPVNGPDMIDTCDLFLTHAWRYHDDWNRMVDALNAHGVRTWRNFSLPWYDPALDPRAPEGGQIVRRQLETQIIPCHAVVFLSGVHEQLGARKWVELEVEMAHRHSKPIIAVPAWGTTELPQEVRDMADVVVPWDGAAVMLAARTLRQRTPAAITAKT
jgi:hypothetical protein